jgi:hypothetical protein
MFSTNSASPTMARRPVLALSFADVCISLTGALFNGSFPFQIDIRDRSGDTGADCLVGQSARVGFCDGFGVGYEIAGSGINGALLGPADTIFCAAIPLRLECNDYDFQLRGGISFRNGVSLVPTAVPEPDSLTLLMVLLGGMVVARRLRWSLRSC